MPSPALVVVDENPEVLQLMARLLTGAGYQVVRCADLRQATTVVQSERPAGVILELRRRYERLGWALVQELRDDPATRAIPVLVCSADTGLLQRRAPMLQQLGVATLTKPFALPDLVSRLTALLAPASPAREDGADLDRPPPERPRIMAADGDRVRAQATADEGGGSILWGAPLPSPPAGSRRSPAWPGGAGRGGRRA
jgi:CheY-like chemotaxis protein